LDQLLEKCHNVQSLVSKSWLLNFSWLFPVSNFFTDEKEKVEDFVASATSFRDVLSPE